LQSVKSISAKYKKNYPVLFGVPRSGGTLIYNITNTIFDGNIANQSHNFFKTNKKKVIVYRDFRDSSISGWIYKQRKSFKNPEDYTPPSEIPYHNCSKEFWHIKRIVNSHLNKFSSSDSTLFLQYEKFVNNFDYIFDQYENFFDFVVEDSLREHIVSSWNIDRVKKVYTSGHDNYPGSPAQIRKIKSQNASFHSGHVFSGEGGVWRQIIRKKDHKYVNAFFEKELKKWGYEAL
jgi:hypothetical protein